MTPLPPPPSPGLQIGERYACSTDHPERHVEVVVGKLDNVKGHVVVSASAFIQGAGPLGRISHIPIEAGALVASCPTRISAHSDPAPDFPSAYQVWQAHGGYFTIGVDQIIDIVLKTVSQTAGPQT